MSDKGTVAVCRSCPECGHTPTEDELKEMGRASNYCPNCGFDPEADK